jgi:mevalonate kinase
MEAVSMGLELQRRARACGKVILLGEHSVVYGYPALAAGLPDGLLLEASALDDPRAWTRVRIPSWELDLRLEPDTDHPVARACLEVLGHCDGPLLGWNIEGTTRLPSRAGLGSSAALSVALARLALGEEAPMEEVIAASLAGEQVFHGEPSGLDSEVAARGGVMTFVRGEPGRGIEPPEPITLVIVASGIPRSTADQVAAVRARRARLPNLIEPLLKSLGEASAEGADAIRSSNMNRLGEIMNVSHEVLSGLGVSTPELDELCNRARAHGALGAKLTGAGGGGSVLALTEPARAPKIVANFAETGHESFAVEIAAVSPRHRS